MTIAERIRGLRHSRNLTLSELARRSRISKGHLHSVEHQKLAPSLRTLMRISEGFDIELRRLLTLTSLEIALEDTFVQQVKPFLNRLNSQQRASVLRTLEAAPKSRKIGNGENGANCQATARYSEKET